MKMKSNNFMWCCGIEDTFISDPYKKTGKILDEYELTNHYTLWKDGFDRIASIVIEGLRWGIPWYRIQPERNKWDWSWTDEVIPYLVEEKGIMIILDFMHYGVPRWLPKAFVDKEYPDLVLEYTQRVIERYKKYINYVVPFNEPHTACEFAGRQGVWPPYLNGYQGYFAVLRGIVDGVQKQTKFLQSQGITTVQVECSGGSVALDVKQQKQAEIDSLLQSQFFDFLTGVFSLSEKFFSFYNENGLTEVDLDRFIDNKCSVDIMGINFYPQFSFQNLSTGLDGNEIRRNHYLWIEDLRILMHSRYARYRCPMMITETSIRDDSALKRKWLRESSHMVFQEYQNGFPVVGYTWFPIIDMFDWEYRTNDGPKEDFKACFGFWNYEREPNECVNLYQNIISGQGGLS